MQKNHRSPFLRFKNRNGQVALFVALVFQVLFLFFAMVVNVGLLVHHKINLQNSVDLAAYYGASKQAENLNAIAHMNYQIRQSWKLLAWRYRMLGSAGEWNYNPWQKTGTEGGSSGHLNDQRAIDTVYTSEPTMDDYQEAPSFCVTYIPFKPMPPKENTCRDMATMSGVKLFSPPRVFGFLQVSATMNAVSTKLLEDATNRCKVFGSYNYMMLAKFVVAYNADQRDRMLVMNAISKDMSSSTDDFSDINGDSVAAGTQTTFQNNLTAPNREGITKFKVYNSLAHSSCGSTGDDNSPTKWLRPIKIYPGFNYIDTQCNHLEIKPVGKEFNGDENAANNPAATSGVPFHYGDPYIAELTAAIKQLLPYVGYTKTLTDTYNFSLGVEKNPWCVAYFGVSASTQPKIPFSPFDKVTLSARAFFKPFGGRVGPWYTNQWNPTESQSASGAEKTDALVPPRVTDIANIGGLTTAKDKAVRAANYSRYVGDPYGLKSAMMIGYYSRSIYQLDPSWRNGNISFGANGLYQGDSAPSFADWDALPFKFTQGTGDILAWNATNDAPSTMRELEMSAVVPNAFDATYYSIEPDYYNNYFAKLGPGFMSKKASSIRASLRPDIGFHANFNKGSYNFKTFSVKDQIAEVQNFAKTSETTQPLLPITSKFTYTILDWANVLTGWTGKDLVDYSLNTDHFGKCATQPADGVPTPGNCVVGGSTGYSVKMVSSDFLKATNLHLGGDNTTGGLLNPPPDDF
ncbi:MAG TPA: Tad domain-containing protein [Bdellovibrio sp.]|uniref:Tad domain-containing protein n=1 Tax=Bdellovibrio sp. TaxID=28201 RepID=UPI002F0C7FF3